MKLKRFRVKNFRSVIDSGLIKCEDVTTLVGINESGKTNILLALWKLNPIKNGEIDPSHDIPASKVSELRGKFDSTFFIYAVFELGESAESINKELGTTFSPTTELILGRNYRGNYSFCFGGKDNQKKLKDLLSLRRSVIRNGERRIICFTEEKVLSILMPYVPTFVYYSNYSNLESKIYLPHAIKMLKGEDISIINTKDDQIRTTRILFDYMRVSPEELYKMGRDPLDLARENRGSEEPSVGEIRQAELEKENRTLLLQDAGRRLTKEFNESWKQGKYTFHFYVDGDCFFIGVSDDKRPEEINLAQRSTGLQSFLSFYLIFLMETQKENKNSILLLDETGLTLHPIAQRDLASFFNVLAKNNQIIHTTHSPFIVDPERIDRCRVVYTDEAGGTAVSEDLRKGSTEKGRKSIYAVHAALGLTVSDMLFQGCKPVIVEGVSDQIYLSFIKRFLIREKNNPVQKDLIFVPVGGAKNVSSVASLLTSTNDVLPIVLLDSDKMGDDFRNKLESELYKENKKRILSIKTFTQIEQSEIEDLIPSELIAKSINSVLVIRSGNELKPDESKPILPQIEDYAAQNKVTFDSGSKVELAKTIGKEIENNPESVPDKYKKMWISLFKKMNG